MTSQQKTLQPSRELARLTIGVTYFEDPDYLQRQLDLWKTWPAGVDIFLVDDGSSEYPALDKYTLEEHNPTLQVWKVTRNLGFNSHGCRNLIGKYATTDAIQFIDLDMLIPPGQVALLKKVRVDENKVYHHKGKHGIVSETVDKTEYMGEDFLAPLRIRDVKKLTGTKTQRIDFPFVKLL